MKKKPLLISSVIGLMMMILITTACTPVSPLTTPTQEVPAPTEVAVETEPPPDTSSAQASPTPQPESPDPTPTAAETTDSEKTGLPCDNPFEGVSVLFSTSYWPKTNFCKHSIDYSEILSGGPPPDGIPAIDAPQFESVEDADTWLSDNMPVMFFEWNGDARAYPLAILIWHEIVNDEVGGLPVALTFCPLCNSTIAFNRQLPDGTVLDFGTSGNLRNSDLVMYDRQTQSWWQQFTGEAIVGDYTGTRLEFLPSQIIGWGEFKANNPDGKVLSRDTGYNRDYGRNPYSGYDDIRSSPFLFTGRVDSRLPAMERVVAVGLNDVFTAYPFSDLKQVKVVNDTFEGEPIVVFWKEGTTSALDKSSIEESKDVGSTAVFKRVVDGQVLTFEYSEQGFVDQETGSLWNLFGEAVEGPLAGTQLEQVVSAEHFWFAWAAFRPDTVIWSP